MLSWRVMGEGGKALGTIALTSLSCPPPPPPHRFQAEGGYVLYPQIGDRLDLLCPRARPPGPHSSPSYEFYKLYLVGGAQGRRCEAPPAPNLLLTCDRPDLDLRFTIKFQEYSPNLWGHEFRSHHDYYIIGIDGQGTGASGCCPWDQGQARVGDHWNLNEDPLSSQQCSHQGMGTEEGPDPRVPTSLSALLSQPHQMGLGKGWRACREVCA